MFANLKLHSGLTNFYSNNAKALRYALGSSILMCLAAGIAWNMSFLVPVLALGFLAPGKTAISFKQGLAFILIIFGTTFFSLVFTKMFLEYILFFLLTLALVLLYTFYTVKLGALAKTFMLISLLLMPMLGQYGIALALGFSKTFVAGAILTVVMVWIIYGLFPDKEKPKTKDKPDLKAVEIPSAENRLSAALESLLIVFPVLLVFFFFQWSGALITLIFIAILSMQPTFNSKAGMAMVLGNLLGGVFAIGFYELLVIVPHFVFFAVLLFAVSMFFTTKLFSNSPKAPLYGMGYSTFLLIIGQSVTSTADAGDKVWLRVLQIMAAVLYIVIALSVIEAYKNRKRLNVYRINKTKA